MTAPSGSARQELRSRAEKSIRLAIVGPQAWLAQCTPASVRGAHSIRTFSVSGHSSGDGLAEGLASFDPHVTVLLDIASLSSELLERAPGTTLGVLVDGIPPGGMSSRLEAVDRLLSFDPQLTWEEIAGKELWRAIPPPVGDRLFSDGQRREGPPRALSIGVATPHREWMLLPAKHHHDLLEVIQGAHEDHVRALFAGHDIGVYIPPEPTGGFGAEIGQHLAAGRLLLCGELSPTHGLERGIDYLQVDTPDGLVWVLDRLARFPGMYRRIRIRGRMKAEQYRASRVFSRLIHDLRADVGAFG